MSDPSRSKRGRYVHTDGTVYRSKKFPMLEEIFKLKNPNNEEIPTIPFTLKDISDAYRKLGIPEPASISNTILDLTRKEKGGVDSRLPKSISSLGYDLRKKTGGGVGKDSLAGEFVFVGIGNELTSWLKWPDFTPEITIDSSKIPSIVLDLIRNDEGALFSIVDYSDALSIAVDSTHNSIIRVQNPMKWQPNEIDGFYARTDGSNTVYAIEAKALSTTDDINLVQMEGGVKTVCNKLENISPGKYTVTPLALQGVYNGFIIGVFPSTTTDPSSVEMHNLILERAIKVRFDPPISNWSPLKKSPSRAKVAKENNGKF